MKIEQNEAKGKCRVCDKPTNQMIYIQDNWDPRLVCEFCVHKIAIGVVSNLVRGLLLPKKEVRKFVVVEEDRLQRLEDNCHAPVTFPHDVEKLELRVKELEEELKEFKSDIYK